MRTESAETNWFPFTIDSTGKGAFFVLEDIRADVEIDRSGYLEAVTDIFTETKCHKTGITTRCYLPKHDPLYAQIKAHVIRNFDEIGIDAEPSALDPYQRMGSRNPLAPARSVA